MVHYHVWFSLKEGVETRRGTEIVEVFLREECSTGEAVAFSVGKDREDSSEFHAVLEFADDDAMALAMKNQHARGIRRGRHGEVVDVVSSFRVKVVTMPIADASCLNPYACEI